MSKKGVVLLGSDAGIEAHAKSHKLPLVVDEGALSVGFELPFDKALITRPGIEVPWDLLPAAWHFLERWDAAVPLWRYGVVARDVGSKEDRAATEAVIRDLRILLHAVELLFIRKNEDGRALLAAYQEELAGGGDERLAFLRANYRVKPRLCVLTRSWLARLFARSKQDAVALRGKRRTGQRLVEVELGPGQFVKCNPGDEDVVLAAMTNRRAARRRKRK